jgi:hypothetical protein
VIDRSNEATKQEDMIMMVRRIGDLCFVAIEQTGDRHINKQTNKAEWAHISHAFAAWELLMGPPPALLWIGDDRITDGDRSIIRPHQLLD